MKCIVSEDQFLFLKKNIFLVEQPDTVMDRRLGIQDRNMRALGLDPGKISDIRTYEDTIDMFSNVEWDHSFAAVVSLIVSFIPPPYGPAISTIIQLADAAVYLYEGDEHQAGLAATFALMPYIGPIYKTFPIVRQMGRAKFLTLVKKLITGSRNFTREERLFILTFEKNTGFFVREIKNMIGRYIPKWLKLFKNYPALQAKMRVFADKCSYYLGEFLDSLFTEDLYNYVFEQEIKIKIEEYRNGKISWEQAKKNFGSDGSRKDNELLAKAFDSGRFLPEYPFVPEEFWTETKRKQMQDLAPTINNLRKVLPPKQAEKEIEQALKMYGNSSVKKQYPWEDKGLVSPFVNTPKSKQASISQGAINK